MCRILLTGGVGFLGSTICQTLHEDGHQLIVFDSLLWKQGPQIYPLIANNAISQFYHEDVTKWSDNLKREIEMADVILPMAAYVGAPLCDALPEEAIEINETWFSKLLPYLTDQWVLYKNSNSGYGSVNGLCTEETPMNPISLYGQTKYNAEQCLVDYPNFIGFRLATVFGWSYRYRTDLLINNLVYQKKVELFDPHFMRNYIHVRDVARAMRFAIANRMRMGGQIYNLGNDSINMSKLELMEQISAITGAKYTLNDNQTDPDQRNYTVSSQKLYDLGYKPVHNLVDGIRELRDFYGLITEEDFRKNRNY